MSICTVVAAALISISAPACSSEPENTQWPNYQENNFIITD